MISRTTRSRSLSPYERTSDARSVGLSIAANDADYLAMIGNSELPRAVLARKGWAGQPAVGSSRALIVVQLLGLHNEWGPVVGQFYSCSEPAKVEEERVARERWPVVFVTP
jgi:hypothetical protein